jgi:hypothetical protein
MESMALLLVLVSLLFGFGAGATGIGSVHVAPTTVPPTVVSPGPSANAYGSRDRCRGGYTKRGKKRLPRGCAPQLSPARP